MCTRSPTEMVSAIRQPGVACYSVRFVVRALSDWEVSYRIAPAISDFNPTYDDLCSLFTHVVHVEIDDRERRINHF